jgi:peptidoglycan/LPS O-acetylase OafA/YrhL
MKADLNEVHFIRAIASLSVCVFHLYGGNKNLFPADNTLKPLFAFGYLGVVLFFMLSGFIICYALSPLYRHADFKQFMFKRLVRIEPPYLLSIFLVLALNSLSYQITRSSNTINWLDVMAHLAYLNNFGAGEYVNVVYWTLGIEFQFYIIIGLIFPFMQNENTLGLFLLLFIALSCLPVFKTMSTILPYLSIFGLGILTYYYKMRKTVSFKFFILFAVALLIQLFFYQGIPVFAACTFGMLILLYWDYNNRLIRFFSGISFSLYLTHVTIGGKIINLGLRYVETLTDRYLLFITALGISIAFAWIFYRIIENPSILWSKKIKYKRVAIA